MANVVIQTAFIGDLLLTIPLLKNLGHYHQRKKLILVCRKGFGQLFVRLKLVDKVIEVEKGNRASYDRALKKLKRIKIDNIYCPHESFRTALFVHNLRAKGKISFKKWWNGFVFGIRFSKPVNYPDVIRQLSLMGRIHTVVNEKLLSIQGRSEFRNPTEKVDILNFPLKVIPEWLSMSVTEQVGMTNETESLVDWSQPVVFLAPGSVWRTKRWTIEGFIALGRRLIREENNVVIVGIKAEEKICKMISKQIKGSTNLCGKTSMYQMLQLFKWGKALISNDSGAMHFASCVGLPTVAIFGPTTPQLGYRPWNAKSAIVQKDLKCRPCGKHGANKCPIKTHDCMNRIHYEQVYAAYKHVTSI